MSYPAGDTKLALDLVDWYRLWGDRPVGFDTWHARLHPNTSRHSSKRTWLRFRQRLLKSRFAAHVEISVCPDSCRGEKDVAVYARAARAAEDFLDDLAERRAEAARKRAARRDAEKRERRRIRELGVQAAQEARRTKRQTSAVSSKR